jgi:hypothetical protein
MMFLRILNVPNCINERSVLKREIFFAIYNVVVKCVAIGSAPHISLKIVYELIGSY